MASEQPRAPKARNILNIISVPKGPHATGPCRFLELPRELRDDIYSRALIEPRKWDKRHQRACSYYNPAASGEIPPFRLDDGVNDPYWRNEDASVEMTACHKLCVRRKAVSLLRTNKQIYQEASPVFWSNNTFCFESDGLVFVNVLGDLEKRLRLKVQRLAFMDPRFRGLDMCNFVPAMFTVLASMWNLRDLEMPYDLLMVHFREVSELTQIPQLRRIRAALLVALPSTAPDHAPLFLGLSKSCNLPMCANNPEHTGCTIHWHCIQRSNALMDLIDRTRAVKHHPLRNGTRWASNVQHRVWQMRPSKRDHAPYIMQVVLADGTRQQVKIWGLPINHPAGVRRFNSRAIIAERLQGRTWACGTRAVRVVREGEEDDTFQRDGRKAKHYRHMEKEVDRTFEREEERKSKQKAIEARHQAAREKGASKKAPKQRVKDAEEIHAEKEAARRRSKR